NSNECLMTRMQEMSLDYHFKVEQESGSSSYAFFGFNGTAGVWRMAALNEAGGWQDRTTVEDMDLAVRATLKGWKFLYLGSIKVKNELPSNFKAYRYQQHRWSCGPANLFRKMVLDILRNKKVTLRKKLYVIYSFFFVRKVVAHIVTFMLYCVVIPTTILVPEVPIPKWGSVYIPIIITLMNAVGTPRSFHLVVIWILFENVMSLHRTKATFIGLFETNRVNEWVVTEKHGGASKDTSKPLINRRFKISERQPYLWVVKQYIDITSDAIECFLFKASLSQLEKCIVGTGLEGQAALGAHVNRTDYQLFDILKDGFVLPFYSSFCSRINLKFLSHSISKQITRMTLPQLKNFEDRVLTKNKVSNIEAFASNIFDPSLSWKIDKASKHSLYRGIGVDFKIKQFTVGGKRLELTIGTHDIAWFRSITNMPIIIKGILTCKDEKIMEKLDTLLRSLTHMTELTKSYKYLESFEDGVLINSYGLKVKLTCATLHYLFHSERADIRENGYVWLGDMLIA
ncbi:nucleotide-diphospho-sugar transferase, partial [Tanacetum coccineum]